MIKDKNEKRSRREAIKTRNRKKHRRAEKTACGADA